MKTALKTQIEEFLKSLNIDNLEIMDYVDIEEIDFLNAFDSIYGQIDDAGGFNVEIIYYSNAIQYLRQAFECCMKKAIVHFYCFSSTEKSFEKPVEEVKMIAEKCGRKIKVLSTKVVRPYSKETCQIVLDLKVF